MQSVDAVLGQRGKTDFRRKLILWGSLVAAANLIAVIWHVRLLVRVQPGFPTFAIVLLILANLLPVGGVFAFAKGLRKSAAVMVVVPLAVGFLIGGYTHFLSHGSDNVLRMPPGELTFAFQISAVLLEVLEGAGCWVGVRIFNYR